MIYLLQLVMQVIFEIDMGGYAHSIWRNPGSYDDGRACRVDGYNYPPAPAIVDYFKWNFMIDFWQAGVSEMGKAEKASASPHDADNFISVSVSPWIGLVKAKPWAFSRIRKACRPCDYGYQFETNSSGHCNTLTSMFFSCASKNVPPPPVKQPMDCPVTI